MLQSQNFPLRDRDGQTREFYEHHAERYFENTLKIDVSALYRRFLRYLPEGAYILDAGSGSGRDTLAFLQRGYRVEAFDSSPALCELSTSLTGVKTRVLRFEDFYEVERYDGIWACASLLHVPEAQLSYVIARLVGALKSGAAMYVSFKHGPSERIAEDGRFFTDMDTSRLKRLLEALPETSLEELWISGGEGKVHGRGEWLNAIIVKRPEGASHG